MRELTERETTIIEEQLKKSELQYHPLQEELLDHLCCFVEEKMWEGQTFPEALHALQAVFKKDEMKEIETETLSLLHSKSKIMKQLSLAVLPIILLLFFYPHYSEKAEVLVSEIPCLNYEPPSISPLADYRRISSGFGMRIHPIHKIEKMHMGMDFVADYGTPVMATADGKVILTEEKTTGYGKQIMLEHDSVYVSRYAQLSEILVEEGEFVKRGTIIGKVGSSGFSTGPHLHYEIKENGKHVDPKNFLALQE